MICFQINLSLCLESWKKTYKKFIPADIVLKLLVQGTFLKYCLPNLTSLTYNYNYKITFLKIICLLENSFRFLIALVHRISSIFWITDFEYFLVNWFALYWKMHWHLCDRKKSNYISYRELVCLYEKKHIWTPNCFLFIIWYNYRWLSSLFLPKTFAPWRSTLSYLIDILC